MKTQVPVLSIVMPVYNRQNYIRSAVKSILAQTFTDFEFIIIDDGSTDGSDEIIKSYNDRRIRFYKNSENRGIVFSRNRGLEKARGKYVGMFDSDDVALPEKFEKQISFLEKHPEYALCGTWVKWIDENGTLTGEKWKLLAPPEKIPSIMLFRNYFVQPTVVIRNTAIPKGGYSEGFDIVEDSKMWFDVSLEHKVTNIHDYLAFYRVHSGNISKPDEKFNASSRRLSAYILSKLDIKVTEKEIDNHLFIKTDEKISDFQQLKDLEGLLLRIHFQNKKIQLYDQHILKKVIFNRWLKICKKASGMPLKTAWVFIKSPLSRFFL